MSGPFANKIHGSRLLDGHRFDDHSLLGNVLHHCIFFVSRHFGDRIEHVHPLDDLAKDRITEIAGLILIGASVGFFFIS